MVREAARSRVELRERLGVDAGILAYPHGDFDGTVEHLVGACGFRQALTCLPCQSSLRDRPLALPRIEVTDRTGVDGLAAALGLAG